MEDTRVLIGFGESAELGLGPPKATWYDKYGRSFQLPIDPYSREHYRQRGLMLTPPVSPLPIEDDPSLADTRQKGKKRRRRRNNGY